MNLNITSQQQERPRFWLPLGILLAIVFVVAGIGGAVTAASVDTWYRALAKPAINPPDWIFGPVWTALYILMALAAAVVWRRGAGYERRLAMSFFFAQLALNLGWSCLFFGLHLIGGAFAWLLLLWTAIAGTLIAFWRIDRRAGWLLIPYLAWVSFAGVLNFLIWRLN
ncbi:MAG TPA: TspO/MBR family protein [Dongiaceae bacterium]|nr:TspO/MBR family protein [Dongiaceae bacterium]